MELVELLKSPDGALILELLTILGVGLLFVLFAWLFLDARSGRRALYTKIDDETGELHTRIDETKAEVQGVKQELHDHALEDAKRGQSEAERWGKIAGKLGIDV